MWYDFLRINRRFRTKGEEEMRSYQSVCPARKGDGPQPHEMADAGESVFVHHVQYGQAIMYCRFCGKPMPTGFTEPATACDAFVPKKGLFMSKRGFEEKTAKFTRMMFDSLSRMRVPEYAMLVKEFGGRVPDAALPPGEQSKAGKAFETILAKDASLSPEVESKYQELKKGDSITLGRYRGVPIQWSILDRIGDHVLVISRDCICKAPYYVGRKYPLDRSTGRLLCSDESDLWMVSFVRRFLNYEFFDSAFSSEEKYMISYPVDGREEEEQLFILNRTDLHKYFDSDPDALTANLFQTKDPVMYWIRGLTRGRCNAIGYRGNLLTDVSPDDDNTAIRPMMWVRWILR